MPKVKHLALRQVINRWWFGDTANPSSLDFPSSLADPKSLAEILVEEGYRKIPSVEQIAMQIFDGTALTSAEAKVSAIVVHAMLMKEEKDD